MVNCNGEIVTPKKMIVCPECEGGGWFILCENCHGTGKIEEADNEV